MQGPPSCLSTDYVFICSAFVKHSCLEVDQHDIRNYVPEEVLPGRDKLKTCILRYSVGEIKKLFACVQPELQASRTAVIYNNTSIVMYYYM